MKTIYKTGIKMFRGITEEEALNKFDEWMNNEHQYIYATNFGHIDSYYWYIEVLHDIK